MINKTNNNTENQITNNIIDCLNNIKDIYSNNELFNLYTKNPSNIPVDESYYQNMFDFFFDYLNNNDIENLSLDPLIIYKQGNPTVVTVNNKKKLIRDKNQFIINYFNSYSFLLNFVESTSPQFNSLLTKALNQQFLISLYKHNNINVNIFNQNETDQDNDNQDEIDIYNYHSLFSVNSYVSINNSLPWVKTFSNYNQDNITNAVEIIENNSLLINNNKSNNAINNQSTFNNDLVIDKFFDSFINSLLNLLNQKFFSNLSIQQKNDFFNLYINQIDHTLKINNIQSFDKKDILNKINDRIPHNLIFLNYLINNTSNSNQTSTSLHVQNNNVSIYDINDSNSNTKLFFANINKDYKSILPNDIFHFFDFSKIDLQKSFSFDNELNKSLIYQKNNFHNSTDINCIYELLIRNFSFQNLNNNLSVVFNNRNSFKRDQNKINLETKNINNIIELISQQNLNNIINNTDYKNYIKHFINSDFFNNNNIKFIDKLPSISNNQVFSQLLFKIIHPTTVDNYKNFHLYKTNESPSLLNQIRLASKSTYNSYNMINELLFILIKNNLSSRLIRNNTDFFQNELYKDLEKSWVLKDKTTYFNYTNMISSKTIDQDHKNIQLQAFSYLSILLHNTNTNNNLNYQNIEQSISNSIIRIDDVKDLLIENSILSQNEKFEQILLVVPQLKHSFNSIFESSLLNNFINDIPYHQRLSSLIPLFNTYKDLTVFNIPETIFKLDDTQIIDIFSNLDYNNPLISSFLSNMNSFINKNYSNNENERMQIINNIAEKQLLLFNNTDINQINNNNHNNKKTFKI